jgi:two-component system, sensor histidine kinase PdtaS
MSITALESDFASQRAVGRDMREQEKRYDALAADLRESLAREEALLQEKGELSRRHGVLAQEFEHRLINGLQLIASLLSMQSRAATTSEAATQLTIASRRVSALGRVHHQLHRLDHRERIEFKHYLQNLCEDLSGLLFQEGGDTSITVKGTEAEVPTLLAIPLGFIVNELITNSVKYAKSSIVVRFETMLPNVHSLSVCDDGPGLPTGFDPAGSKGLGMTIVQSLVQQIGGELDISPDADGKGACFKITFCSPQPQTA